MSWEFNVHPQDEIPIKTETDFGESPLNFQEFDSPDFKIKELKRDIATVQPTLAEESSKRLRVNQSWIFTYGYGERVETEEGKRVKCLVPGCGRMYSTSNSSTSNLKKHLQTMHNINESSGEGFLSSKATHRRGQDLQAALEDFIIGNRISHRAVEDPKFRRLLELAQSVNIADLYITAKTMQEGMVRSTLAYKQRLKNMLSTNQCLSLTFDRWVCGTGKYFYGATVHFIDENWTQRDALIAFMDSAEKYGDRIHQTLVELDILNKVFTVTADYSSEMIDLTRSLVATCPKFKSQNHIPCLGYILTEAISHSLQPSLEFDAVLSKTRQGITRIKASPQANVYFHALLLEPTNSTMDDLLWDSCYDMISTVLNSTAAYNETCALFGFPQFSLTSEDCMFLEELRHLLGMFHSFTESLLTYRYVSTDVSF
ncbi:hypothetical protein DSO57_1039579 [Entomophthora muscae]|uniref:Uncharacterized protein n=1 Tax=Entomophthora muscae TaxID=34485 RepID=A0ACC2SMG9_9FUNG|nr:hypothetical protein DSO57_1039579 [Entomophthora muscae]